MTDIEGNISAVLQTKEPQKNTIGEAVSGWTDAETLTGFLDLSSGSSSYSAFNAKIQESTHIFLCDYVALDVDAENCRAVIDGKVFDVLLIDDPIELHEHLEIYLKFVGGQNEHTTDR